MNGWEYQNYASQTNDDKHFDRLSARMCINHNVPEILNACLGLSGEVGELVDMIKKYIYHEKELDEYHLKKELGDVMWYVSMFCKAMGWSLDDVMALNIEKLTARYPEGFDPDKSNHRKSGDV